MGRYEMPGCAAGRPTHESLSAAFEREGSLVHAGELDPTLPTCVRRRRVGCGPRDEAFDHQLRVPSAFVRVVQAIGDESGDAKVAFRLYGDVVGGIPVGLRGGHPEITPWEMWPLADTQSDGERYVAWRSRRRSIAGAARRAPRGVHRARSEAALRRRRMKASELARSSPLHRVVVDGEVPAGLASDDALEVLKRPADLRVQSSDDYIAALADEVHAGALAGEHILLWASVARLDGILWKARPYRPFLAAMMSGRVLEIDRLPLHDDPPLDEALAQDGAKLRFVGAPGDALTQIAMALLHGAA